MKKLYSLSTLNTFMRWIITMCLAICTTAQAFESSSEQAVMLPMNELLKRLGNSDDWQIIPLSQYQELCAEQTKRNNRIGGWIESAQVIGIIGDDDRIQMHAILTVIANGPFQSCPLFSTPPSYRGITTIDGEAAMTVVDCQSAKIDSVNSASLLSVVNLILPHSGRHVVILDWSSKCEENGGNLELPLPLAAVLELKIHSSISGKITGEDLRLCEDGSYRLIHHVNQLKFHWQQGERREAANLFGMSQQLNLRVEGGQRQFSWIGRWDIRQGNIPTKLDLTLPAGWVPVMSNYGATVLNVQGNQLHLLCSAGSEIVGFQGFLSNEAEIALPHIHQALWENGELNILSDQALDIQPPARWEVLDPTSPHGVELRFSIPGPEHSTKIITLGSIRHFGCDCSAWLLLGTDKYILEQSLILMPGSDQYQFKVRTPEGWHITTLTVPEGMSCPDISTIKSGDIIAISSPHGSIEKSEWKIHLIMERKSTDHLSLNLASIIETTAQFTRLDIVYGPALDIHAEPIFPWQTAAPGTLISANYIANTSNIIQLVAATSPSPIPLEITHHSINLDADIVYNVVPNGIKSWCRVDMRIQAREGELQDLVMEAPWSQESGIQISAPWTITPQHDGNYLLHAAESWNGVRLLRIEGSMRYLSGKFPIINLFKIDNTPITLHKTLIVSQSSADAFEIIPGSSAHVIDSDEIPLWSAPIPSSRIVGTYHIDGSDLGHIVRIERPITNGPSGFIDQFILRTQIDRDSAITVCRAIVAAPGLSILEFNMQPNQHIITVTIDGRTALLHREGNRVSISLPGRTQVEISIQFHESVDPHRPYVHAPRFTDIPITHSSWNVAIAGNNLVESAVSDTLMPLELHHSVFESWFGKLKVTDEFDVPIEAPHEIIKQDERQVNVHALQISPRGQPTLILSGIALSGQRLGIADIQLDVISLSQFQHWIQLLSVICIGFGIAIGRIMRSIYGLGIAILALFCAFALNSLHGFFQLATVPIFGFALGVLIGICIDRFLIRIQINSKQILTKNKTLTLMTFGLLFLSHQKIISSDTETISPSIATAPSVIFMGYHQLNAQQIPQGVVVALTKDRFDALSIQGTDADINGVHGIACGPMRYQINLINEHLQGTLTFPIFVSSEKWQLLRLNVGDSMVSGVKAFPLGVVKETMPTKMVTWTTEDRQLVLHVVGKQAILVELTLGWNRIFTEHGWELKVPGSVSGGTVNIELPKPVQLHVASILRTPDSIIENKSRWSLELPPMGTDMVLSSDTQSFPIPSGIINIFHTTTIRILSAHFEWQDDLSITSHGDLPHISIQIPNNLIVTRVAGNGLSSWHQDANMLLVYWAHSHSAENQFNISIYGIMIRKESENSAVMLSHVPLAKEHGRLRLINSDDCHFVRPQSLDREPSMAGEDIAATWNDPLTTAMATIEWHSVLNDIRVTERSALMVGCDRNRMALHLSFSGVGRISQIQVPLPDDWSLEACEMQGTDGTRLDLMTEHQSFIRNYLSNRMVVVRPATGISQGVTFDLFFVMSQTPSAKMLLVPDLEIHGEGLAVEIQTIVIGDCGDPRVEAPNNANGSEGQIVPLADKNVELVPPGFHLRSDEHWRFSCQGAVLKSIQLALSHDSAIIQCYANHFIKVDNQGVRGSVLVEAAPQQGTVQEIHLHLPDSMNLRSVRAPDLGWWQLDQQLLTVHFAGSSHTPIHCIIDFSIPWFVNKINLEDISSVDGQGFGVQQISIAVSDEEPLVKISATGLERNEKIPSILPLHIDGTLLTESFHSTRIHWKLELIRSSWSVPASADGVVTLMDIRTLIAPDGESRSQAHLSVINRNKNQLAIKIPDNVDLWQIRVDGEVVVIRQDLINKQLHWFSVPLGRVGDAATSIDVIWRQKAIFKLTEELVSPELSDMQIMKCLWKISSSKGTGLIYKGGTLQVCPEMDAALLRSQSVMEDLHRLRSMEGLNSRAIARLSDELQRIDAELDDEQVMLQNIGSSALDQTSRDKAKLALDDIQKTRLQTQAELRRLETENISREHRRVGLGFDQTTICWPDNDQSNENPNGDGPVWGRLILPAPSEVPWMDEKLDPQSSLGIGQAPLEIQSAMSGSLIGIDLLHDESDGNQIMLFGAGQDLRVTVKLQSEHRNQMFLCLSILVFSVLFAIILILIGRRRRNGVDSLTDF